MEDKKALEDSEMEKVTGGSWQKTTQKLSQGMQGIFQEVGGCVVSPYSVCNNFVWLSPAAEVSGAKGRCAVCRHFKAHPGSETTGMCSRCDGSSLHRVVS